MAHSCGLLGYIQPGTYYSFYCTIDFPEKRTENIGCFTKTVWLLGGGSRKANRITPTLRIDWLYCSRAAAKQSDATTYDDDGDDDGWLWWWGQRHRASSKFQCTREPVCYTFSYERHLQFHRGESWSLLFVASSPRLSTKSEYWVDGWRCVQLQSAMGQDLVNLINGRSKRALLSLIPSSQQWNTTLTYRPQFRHNNESHWHLLSAELSATLLEHRPHYTKPMTILTRTCWFTCCCASGGDGDAGNI